MLREIASKHNLQLDIFLKNVSCVETIGRYGEWTMGLLRCVRTRVIALHREKLDVMDWNGDGVQKSWCDARRSWLLLKIDEWALEKEKRREGKGGGREI